MAARAEDLIIELFQAGLIQLGQFRTTATTIPLRTRLEMLPSYPLVLKNCVELIGQSISHIHHDRILATSESISLSVGVSLKTDVSLVYSRGQSKSPVSDFIGAYDVGHPTLLVLNDVASYDAEWLNKAASVGLEICAVLALVGPSDALKSLGEGIEGHILIEYERIFDVLLAHQVINPDYAMQLKAWHN